MFRRIAAGRTFYRVENSCQIRIQVRVAVSLLSYIDEQLTGVNEISFGLGGILFYFRSDNVIREMGIIYTLITSLNKTGKILTDETIEKRAQDKLFEVPSINGTAYLIGYLPNGCLQLVSLLYICHYYGRFLSLNLICKYTIL